MFELGVDLDGVVFDYTEGLRHYMVEVVGHDRGLLPDPTDWDFTGWPFAGRDHFIETHLEALADGLFSYSPVIPGAQEALWRLSNLGVGIHIVTNRFIRNGHHKAAVSQTIECLDKHDLPYDGITFIKDKTRIDVDVLLEDAPHNLFAMIEAGKPVIAFDTLYNRHVDCPRAMNWTEAEEMIRGMMCQKLKL